MAPLTCVFHGDHKGHSDRKEPKHLGHALSFMSNVCQVLAVTAPNCVSSFVVHHYLRVQFFSLSVRAITWAKDVAQSWE